MFRRWPPLFLVLALVALPMLVLAQARDPNALPRYVSLRSDEVNLRAGPGMQYQIEWVIHRRNLPVEIVAEFEAWRRIRDVEGTEGWVHQSMLSARRTALITGEVRQILARPEPEAPVVATVEPGVVALLTDCREQWCRVDAGGYRGWVRRGEFWGIYPGESLR